MAEEDKSETHDISRRDVAKLAFGAAIASSTAAEAADPRVVEHHVSVKTPHGVCDAAFIHPRSGAHPGVLVWTDAFGLRPSMRGIGRRLALQGYSVLVPNPYYRSGAAPTLGLEPTKFSFQNPDDMARLRKLMGGFQTAGSAESDAEAYIAFLDAQRAVDRHRRIGTQGYCMGGPLVFRTVAAVPHRVGAGATFHGGGLVTDGPGSPHLLIPKMHAKMYIGIAANDDERQPDAKNVLRDAFKAAHVAAQVEVYGSHHGWCVPDMPAQNGKPIYNEPDAERAWAKLTGLYKTALT